MKTAETRKRKLLKPEFSSPLRKIKSEQAKNKKTSLTTGVRQRSAEEYKFYSTRNHDAIDRLVDLVIKEELSAIAYVFFDWLSTYCWDRNNGLEKRSPFILGYASAAASFGVTKDTIGRWVKQLSSHGLIEAEYIVKINKTNQEVYFSSHEKAFQAKNELGGYIRGTRLHVLEKGFRVFKKARKQGVLQ